MSKHIAALQTLSFDSTECMCKHPMNPPELLILLQSTLSACTTGDPQTDEAGFSMFQQYVLAVKTCDAPQGARIGLLLP